jgi:hypothetical protein
MVTEASGFSITGELIKVNEEKQAKLQKANL